MPMDRIPWLQVLAGVIGAGAGYAYYYFFGCDSG